MSRPLVAIVGRPNVGKSTLFNRLLGERRAIVEDWPGTTRDRIDANISWEGHEFTIIDSGGLLPRPDTTIEQKVTEQVRMAIAGADLVLFMVDTREGVCPSDLEIADILRRSEKPVLLVANKVDNSRQRNDVLQFYELSMGDPTPVSGYHGRGIDELLDRVTACLPPPTPTPREPEALKIAIVGRPNVGKSLLVNTLLGEERLVVHDMPGTTRDTVDTVIRHEDETVILIDTAGIRRRGRIGKGLERYSFARTAQAIERCDVAVLLTDAVEGLTAQDMHILGYVQQSYKGAIFGINKWDVAESKDVDQWTRVVKNRTRFMAYIEVLFLSAMTGYGVEKVLPTARRVYRERMRRLPTSRLDEVVRDAMLKHSPPKKGPKRLKFYKVTQTGVNPPSFSFYVNDPKLVHFSYRRYMENSLRQTFGFQGTPLHLTFKARYEKEDGRK